MFPPNPSISPRGFSQPSSFPFADFVGEGPPDCHARTVRLLYIKTNSNSCRLIAAFSSVCCASPMRSTQFLGYFFAIAPAMMSTSVFLFFLYMHTPSSLFLLRHCQTFLFFFTPTRESLERGHLPFFFDRNRSSHPSHVIDAVSCDWMQHANIFETGKKTLLPFPAASTDQAEEKQTSGRIYKVDEKITESYRGETNDRNHRNLVAVQYLGIHTKVSVRGGILKIEPLVCRTIAFLLAWGFSSFGFVEK